MLERYLSALDLYLLEPLLQRGPLPVTTETDTLIHALLSREDLILKRADKAAVFVIMRTEDYRAEALSERHLSNRRTYTRLEDPPQLVLDRMVRGLKRIQQEMRCWGVPEDCVASLEVFTASSHFLSLVEDA